MGSQAKQRWNNGGQSNNFTNQDKQIKEVSIGTSKQAIPICLGGSDATPASSPIFSKNPNQTLIMLLKAGRSKRCSLAQML